MSTFSDKEYPNNMLEFRNKNAKKQNATKIMFHTVMVIEFHKINILNNAKNLYILTMMYILGS